MEPKTIKIDNIEYVRKDQAYTPSQDLDGMPYKVIRTYSAGVFAGYLESRNGKECQLRKARRIWYWDGAASLSQLAVDGTSKPENCKFAKPVDVELTEVIEVISTTKKAQESIEGCSEWVK